MFYLLKKGKIYAAYVSKHNSSCKKTSYSFNDSKWRRMALTSSKKTVGINKRITSKQYGDFYCLNCLNSFRTNNKLESHKKYVKIKIFIMQLCLLKILKY